MVPRRQSARGSPAGLGQEIETAHGNAARFLQRRSGIAGSGTPAGAITDLMAAAEDPTDHNLARANDQFSASRAQEGPIDGNVRRADADLEARTRTMLPG